MAKIGKSGSGGVGSGWIRIANISTQDTGGVTDLKIWQDVGETVLQECRVSSLALVFRLQASGPLVKVDGNTLTLVQSTDEGHYEGDVNATLTAGGPIICKVFTPDGAEGAFATITITHNAAPMITVLSFSGDYPGSQSELKAGDIFLVTGTTDKDIDLVEVIDQDAGANTLTAVATGQAFTTAITVADRGTTSQALPAQVRVRDAITGAFSAVRATNEIGGSVDKVDIVTLNNTFFGMTFGTVTYPLTQSALKDAESATVAISTDYLQVGANTIVYDSPGSQLVITNPTLHEATKLVARIGGGYNISAPNLRSTMLRASNGAQSVIASGVVFIAHDAPTIAIVLDAARLRSGGNDGTTAQEHRVQIQADQQLIEAPTLVADAGGNRGTFIGAGFTGGPSDWERDLQVDEGIPDEKGAFTFAGLLATNLARQTQAVITTGSGYTLGGFVARDLTFAALQTTVLFNAEVADFPKLTAGAFTVTNQMGVKAAVTTTPPVYNGYSIDALAIDPTTLIWLDTAAAGTNSAGTAQLLALEELA